MTIGIKKKKFAPKVVAGGAKSSPPVVANKQKKEKQSQRDAAFQMILDTNPELFINEGKTYATISVDDHFETYPTHSVELSCFLRKLYRDITGKTLGNSVVSDVAQNLDAAAAYSGNSYDVFVRVAHHDGCIYVDLGDASWRAVCITPDGWSSVTNSPVKFVRKAGMLALPEPVPGGTASEKISALREFVNANDETTWVLIVAWILAAFSVGPFPVLVVTGEPGSAKSGLTWALRQIVDPSEVVSTMNPKDTRDVIIAAVNSHMVALDNLTHLDSGLSDLICCLATGAAHRERAYFTNDGREILFKAQKPVLLNGVNLALKTDLANRAIVVESLRGSFPAACGVPYRNQ